jgi:hypothetical protein
MDRILDFQFLIFDLRPSAVNRKSKIKNRKSKISNPVHKADDFIVHEGSPTGEAKGCG